MTKRITSKMTKKLFLTGMLALIILISFPLGVSAQFDGWIRYVPGDNQVELNYWKVNGASYINISIWFASSGYNVSDWGMPIFVGNNISADAKIWRWTGIGFPLVTTMYYTYILGTLSAGEYLFTFEVWGYPVKNVTFTVFVPAPPPPKPVGGYSFPTEGYTPAQSLTPYLALIAILTISFAAIKRKTTRKTK